MNKVIKNSKINIGLDEDEILKAYKRLSDVSNAPIGTYSLDEIADAISNFRKALDKIQNYNLVTNIVEEKDEEAVEEDLEEEDEET